MYSLFLYIFALRVSGAICTHPQEHKLQTYFELDRAKSVRVSQPVPVPMD
jgi:hypothetical protein